MAAADISTCPYMAVTCVLIICDTRSAVSLNLRATRLLTVTATAPSPSRMRALSGSRTIDTSPSLNNFSSSACSLNHIKVL